MVSISQSGLDLICEFEGFSPVVYDDAVGIPTIGYGHVLLPGERFDEPISEAEGVALLRKDAQIAEQGVRRNIHAPLTQGQYDALVSFTFNLGSGALQRSTLRRRVNRGSHSEAAQEFHRWVYAGGRKLRGLVRRRMAESLMYRSESSGFR